MREMVEFLTSCGCTLQEFGEDTFIATCTNDQGATLTITYWRLKSINIQSRYKLLDVGVLHGALISNLTELHHLLSRIEYISRYYPQLAERIRAYSINTITT